MIFIFTTTRTLPSAAIRAIDGGACSHCGILLDDGTVIDSTFKHGGVAKQGLSEFLAGKVVINAIELNLPREAYAVQWLYAQLGKRYDYKALVGWSLWKDWNSRDRWYCSELLVSCAIAGGMRTVEPPRRVGVRLAHELVYAWAARSALGKLGDTDTLPAELRAAMA